MMNYELDEEVCQCVCITNWRLVGRCKMGILDEIGLVCSRVFRVVGRRKVGACDEIKKYSNKFRTNIYY